jgi:prevent-host-death family protein
MKERIVGLRELRSRLSESLREVKGGRELVVTERGRAVARIVPSPTRWMNGSTR